ncbi:HesA/MoeB/ThiF family protein [Sphingomonas bacterium]|uniref:HesA/MoeB/ThiF family protein n=1 Tax=Sphingomonas bacterium TaxID=1895847 RepID=UPI0015765DBD|nr:HesA/MoeB/ThiF family protein [Sphingomonas bacterium]
MTFSDEELTRYARQIVLPELGGMGQARLARAGVAVVGAGGIGSPAIQYLAAAGIGRLVLIDDDRVEISNLQRQTIFAAADAGRLKVEAAADAVARLNPHVMVDARSVRLDAANAAALLAGVDAILDGSDSFATRLAVSDASLALEVPLVSASVAQFEGQLAVYRGWRAMLPCYRCLVGTPADDPDRSCAAAGVLGPVAGVMGSLAAVEAVRAIVPFGADPAGSLLIVDAGSFRFRTIALRKDPACPSCRDGGNQPDTQVH